MSKLHFLHSGGDKVTLTTPASNPSTNPAEFFTLVIGDDPQGSSADSTDEQLGRLYGGQWMMIPWSATNTNFDIMIAPSVATEMTVEYMVFS